MYYLNINIYRTENVSVQMAGKDLIAQRKIVIAIIEVTVSMENVVVMKDGLEIIAKIRYAKITAVVMEYVIIGNVNAIMDFTVLIAVIKIVLEIAIIMVHAIMEHAIVFLNLKGRTAKPNVR